MEWLEELAKNKLVLGVSLIGMGVNLYLVYLALVLHLALHHDK